MSGCFGGSAVDRWMERELNSYLDSQEITGERTLTFKLWKGKKLVNTWQADISNEDGCQHEMYDVLAKIYTKGVTRWLKECNEPHTLVFRSGRTNYFACDQETMNNVYLEGYGDRSYSRQAEIVKQWAMMPKASRISHSTGFNIYRMGKYSITCFDPLQDD